MPATRDTYKGHPTLTLSKPGASERDRGFTFGLAKAELIVEHFEEIKAFVADNTKEKQAA